MSKYSIKELEKLSGIKAHTIRIWEKRHQIIDPSRTETNIRYYSDKDLKKLLNVAILNNHGLKISKIARLSIDDLYKEVTELSKEQDNQSIFIDQLTIAMIDMDELKFEQLLSSLILRFGFERTINEIIYPFLKKIGLLWLSDNISPIQEHFISNLIRQKIIVAIDALDVRPTNSLCAVLFLPEDELHEIGLLYFHYLIKSRGFKTYYLGQFVPFQDLIDVVKQIKPDFLVTAVSYKPADFNIEEYVAQLATTFHKYTLLVNGHPVWDLKAKLPKNVLYFQDGEKLEDIISTQL